MQSSPDSILITGASGTLGKQVVAELVLRGTKVTGVGRREAPHHFPGEWLRGDLLKAGTLLKQAVPKISAVIHCASSVKAPQTDLVVLRNIVEALRGSDAQLIFVSIVGIDRAAQVLPYYKVKMECEELLRQSGITHGIVRIAQFYPFVEMILSKLTLGPVILRPKLNLQPVDIKFAAEQLAIVSSQPPQTLFMNVTGPDHLTSAELIREWVRIRRKSRWVIPIPPVGSLKAFSLIEPVTGNSGGPTWSDWLTLSQGKSNPYLKTKST